MINRHEQCTAAGCSEHQVSLDVFSDYSISYGPLCFAHLKNRIEANDNPAIRRLIAGCTCVVGNCDQPVLVEYPAGTGLIWQEFCETHLPAGVRFAFYPIRVELSARSLCPALDCGEPRLVISYAPGVQRLQPLCFEHVMAPVLRKLDRLVWDIQRKNCYQCGRYLADPYVCTTCLLPADTVRDTCRYSGCDLYTAGFAYCHRHRKKRSANQKRRRIRNRNTSQDETG